MIVYLFIYIYIIFIIQKYVCYKAKSLSLYYFNFLKTFLIFPNFDFPLPFLPFPFPLNYLILAIHAALLPFFGIINYFLIIFIFIFKLFINFFNYYKIN